MPPVAAETAAAALAGRRDGELALALEHIYHPDGTPGMVPAYHFLLVLGGAVAGRIRLRVGHDERMLRFGGQVGYEVDPPWRGRRLAARAVLLLLPLARAHALDPLWFTCNPDNAASRRTLERIGARFIERIVPTIVDQRRDRSGEGEKDRYCLDLPPG